eukprot:CAMPEP_0182809296 /NCGR_PEP_ID=MMETSP0006_2-20121128/7107_1 /TAXON_ID=97485 /ORGANISM="Prymnesium parvum, Strain Texoma1" /LENGTH=250 /DNA_ID=CAMNT_0024935069 /DNA_START=234 /DNA_END=987 /DNA_ORIENTATION=-
MFGMMRRRTWRTAAEACVDDAGARLQVLVLLLGAEAVRRGVSTDELLSVSRAEVSSCPRLPGERSEQPVVAAIIAAAVRELRTSLDHGLYHPQLVRWLQFFHPSQLLIISFAGFISQPSEVFHDVLIHAGLPRTEAKGAVERLQQAPATAHRKKMENSRAKGHGRMAAKSRAQLHEFYAPFIERLYGLLNDKHISVSPCREMGTRFLDPPENYSASVPWRDNANARPFGQVRWKTSATQFSLGSESAHSE